MYNKIASIILNSAKTNSLSDVFVAQPDSLKESLAGKIFVLAEIGGRKASGKKIFNFLIEALNTNYYNDEKILFRDKIEGLKIENIFEAAITKTNQDLVNFLTKEKIILDPTVNSITLGVIYENKLHFSIFGNNRALLLYNHHDQYEIINVESNIREEDTVTEKTNTDPLDNFPKLFSSVISGEIPLNSYFIFTNEALLEYLSNQDIVKIITKLPPLTAVEQIKNILLKINTYVPFLGIIVKNTTGLNQPESSDNLEEALSAHGSISSLNYTEAKTEEMLTPAGIISFSRVFNWLKNLVKNYQLFLTKLRKARVQQADQDKSTSSNRKVTAHPSEKKSESDLNLGPVQSLSSRRPDSFLIKDKIFFKKKSGLVTVIWSKLLLSLKIIFDPRAWLNLVKQTKSWIHDLDTKNRRLFILLASIIIVFVASLLLTNWNHQRQLAQTNFNNLVTNIKDQENSIDTHLLYHDQSGAKQIFIQTQALLNSLPQQTKAQQLIYNNLALNLRSKENKIEKIIVVKSAKQVANLQNLGVQSLIYTKGQIYAASKSTIYDLKPGNSTYTKIHIFGANNLSNPVFYSPDLLYYWDNKQIASYNIKTGHSNLSSEINLNSSDQAVSFKMFYGNLYLLVPNQNQIYKYSARSRFQNKTNWFPEKVNLSQASDLYIDGNIYILLKNGEVQKYFKGALAYSSAPLNPIMTDASKLIIGERNIYIFEASSKRLVVLAKSDGHLLNQYQFNFLSSPQDFTVDENAKLAYILNNGGVYKISLQQ